MKSLRRYSLATLAVIALLPVACAKKKSKKNDAQDSTPEVPAEVAATPVATPLTLIGRITLKDLAGSTQLQATFAATQQAVSAITNGSLAATAYTSGQPLKFSGTSDTTLENSAGLGGGYYSGNNGSYGNGGYYGSYSDSYGGCNCGWNFPILNGIAGFVSNVGSLIFGWGQSYGNSYGYGSSSYGQGSSYGYGYGYGDSGYSNAYGNYDANNPPFPFGPGTSYQNPSYIWTPNGPVYNNPTYNPFPATGIQSGTIYNTGISGCTPAVFDDARGWIAAQQPISQSAPLCNGQTAPAGIGPTPGTTYSTGAESCVPATYNGKTWQPTQATADTNAPLCDGNVYDQVTSTSAAVNNQMPGFAPTYTANGATVTFKYSGTYDDASYRYYLYAPK